MRTVVLSLGLMLLSAAALADDRVGLAEPCDSTDGWVPGMDVGQPDERYRPKSFKSEGGQFIIDTQLGVLDGIARAYFAARNIEPLPGICRINKRYGAVDLDKHHYLVARMPTAPGCASLRINRKETKVLYTTGLHAQDLQDIGLMGRTEVSLQLIAHNGTGRVVVDDIRLVSALTPEEQRALIPGGFEIREQKLKAGPYQGLDALYERGRAPVLKLTRYPGADSATQFSANGRWVIFRNPTRPGYNEHVVDLRTHRVLPLPPGEHKCYPKHGDKTALVSFGRQAAGGRLTVQECDLRTMAVKTILDKDVPNLPIDETEFSFSDESNRFVIGFRQHDVVFLVDPDATEVDRLRPIKLPHPIKGLGLAHQDRLIAFNNCFTYQGLYYDHQEGKTYVRGQRFAGGHTATGGVLFGPYGSILKLVAPRFDRLEAPGDAIRIHSNYFNSLVDVDYGTVSPDGRWAFQDGARGDVNLQIVAFDLNDGGSVAPVFFHNTSSVGWDVKPYVKVSPDSTKLLFYSCDMLGDGDALVVPFQRPEPPREVNVKKSDDGLLISWKPAARSAETWGYHVYHSTQRTGGFVRVNKAILTETKFVHPGADPRSVYLVTAVENSGPESRFPPPAMLSDRPRDDAACVFLEAECADEMKLPFRRQYNGLAANFAAMRLMPETPEETEGALAFQIPAERLHATGSHAYELLLRCRLRTDIYPEVKPQDALAHLDVDGREAGAVKPPAGPAFRWSALQPSLTLAPGDHRLVVRSKTPGLEIDRVALMGAPIEPLDSEPEILASPVQRPEPLTIKPDGPFAMSLSWPSPKQDVAYYSIHSSAKPEEEPSNETLVGSTDATRFRDTGLRLGTAILYHVVGYDTRGRAVAAYTGQGKRPALANPHTVRLEPKSAKLGEALELVTEDGRGFVRVKPNLPAGGDAAALTFNFELPRAGDYSIWFYNRPQSENRYMTFRLDQVVGSLWAERFMLPGARVEMMSRTPPKPRRWYVNRLLLRLPSPRNPDGTRSARVACQDVFPLAAGLHTLTLSLDTQSVKPPSADIAELLVTNDLTCPPPDHDPRAHFKPEG